MIPIRMISCNYIFFRNGLNNSNPSSSLGIAPPMKRKDNHAKKDYNKHWLIQEAEQRRVEQDHRITRSKSDHKLTKSQFHQKVKSNLPPPPPTTAPSPSSWNDNNHYMNMTPPPYNGNHGTSSYNNNYDPTTPPPGGPFVPPPQLPKEDPPPILPSAEYIEEAKPLPDSIIDTLTQRVKNRMK